ncbi:MAG: M12 family metallo-peptidase, partial [Planctomycetota bacterium]|nr:M12 family metallo-peptidase [Planctomycetota bacterium]
MAIQHLIPAGVLTLAGLMGTPALAQNVDTLPFPLVPQATALVDGTFEYQARPGAFVDLMGRQALIMDQVELPGGAIVDLDLTRVNYDFGSMGVQVNGQPSTFDALDLTLWRGQVSGSVGSDVFLAFSSHGCNGWILADGEYNHLMAFAGPGNDWSQAQARLVPESIMNGLGGAPRELCGNDGILNGPMTPTSILNDAQTQSLGSTFNLGSTLECKVAVETDYQYYQNWNNLTACQTYTATLLAEISDRYESQIDVVLTYPYLQFYTSSNDPWTSQGGGAGAVLDEFRNAWIGNIPSGGNLAHFMSGANLGGGVAYLDVLCNSTWGFGVSGNMSGGTQFPVTQSSNTWDFTVMAHELGHNFGTGHTHDYCPPIDECASSNYFGQCQNSRNCISNGTVMSYCHT